MTLEILVCTIDNSINNIKNLLLAPIEGVSYLISWQHDATSQSNNIPCELIRSDVKIVHLNGKGLSRNRNNAINYATGDICLIADDDCTYKPEYFSHIINTFKNNETLEIATFKMQSISEIRFYPDYSFPLNKFPKNYFITSFEIAFRRTSIQGKLKFNELFGLGAPVLQSGEENIFINDAIKAGLNCRYFPLTIVEHHHATTATTRNSWPGVIMAEGAYIFIAYRYTSIPRLILKAYRLSKNNGLGTLKNLNHLINGILYYLKNSH